MSILQARSHRCGAAHIVCWQCSVTLRHWRLANIVADEMSYSWRSSECRNSFAGFYLSPWIDWLHPSRTVDVRPAVTPLARDWIVEFVNWTRFFFQAEDGIRDIGVTGVQTCALPIFGPDATAF